jgi:hypothetical protein
MSQRDGGEVVASRCYHLRISGRSVAGRRAHLYRQMESQ